jgi:hypothetical protein
MIAKAVKGKGFRGALEYDLSQEKGQILDSNMAGQNARELAKEFGEIRKLRPTLNKAVLHVSLSAAIGDQLTNEQWREIGHKYLESMGLDNNQFIITRHTDTEHPHIHILANRIQFNGEVTSDSQDYQRQEKIMRQIEQEYHLQIVAPSRQAERRAPTKGEIEHSIRTAQPSTKQQLQQLCDAAATQCKSFTEYGDRLDAAGVELIPVIQMEGQKLSGLSYRLDGIMMKGSDLGKGYSPAGLQKKGVIYEKNRDFETLSHYLEREASRTIGATDRNLEANQNPERGRPGGDDRTISPSNGGIDGRDPANPGRNRQEEPRPEPPIPEPDGSLGAKLENLRERMPESRAKPEQSREPSNLGTLPASDADWTLYGNAHQRIVALCGATQDSERTRPCGSSPASKTRDRTTEALERQIEALGVAGLEIGIREAETGKMINRLMSQDEVKNSSDWLKRMNAKGNDIYIRPSGEHGLVLIDDLKPEALKAMSDRGLKPAAIIQTSPNNYQAWVKLSDKPVSPDIRKMAARGLAKEFGGDLNSADSNHYGRLAGFTNQKQKYNQNGKQPYVLAHDCSGDTSKSAVEYLERIKAHLAASEMQAEQKKRLEAIKAASMPKYGANAGQEYQGQAKRLLEKYGENADLSRIDWMISLDMAKSSKFSQQDIETVLRKHSPNIESRKAGHINDYAKRTAEKAWQAPEALQSRQEKAEQAKSKIKDQDYGPSL